MKMVFVSWDRFHRRSELLADHLGAALHTIHVGQSGRMWQAPARYALQTLQTWRVLGRERPEVILVQNPPIFAALAVYLYARFSAARFAIDSHTGAFIGRRWRWSVRLHRYLSRRADVTIVHNTAQEAIVRNWGCVYRVIGFTPGNYPDTGAYSLPDGFTVAVISTFKEDEPLDTVFEAAHRLPDVAFFFTGNSRRIPARLRAQQPPNCHLTGYLPYNAYVALLRGAGVIMDLTTRDETLLMGGFEAISLGTPLITSNWPVLKDYFHAGTVHVASTVEGICAGVRRAQTENAALRAGMRQLRDELTADWQRRLAELKSLLESTSQAANSEART